VLSLTSVKRSPHWSCDESKKTVCSGDLASFLARPSPLCPWHPWKDRHTGRTTSPKKRCAPEISLRFLCAHVSSYDCMPFCPHMSACGMHQ
jgi:hypothetical protein